MVTSKNGETLNTARNVTFGPTDTHATLMVIGGERLWFPRTALEAAEDIDNGETVVEVL